MYIYIHIHTHIYIYVYIYIFFIIGSYSDIPTNRFAPKSRLVKTSRSRPDGSTEYPSWVSGLGKEYPSWVEDLDISTRHKKVTQR